MIICGESRKLRGFVYRNPNWRRKRLPKMEKQKKASKIRATNNEIECTQIDLLLKTLKKNNDEKK
jgi:uncharacterized protein (DUF2267 family)